MVYFGSQPSQGTEVARERHIYGLLGAIRRSEDFMVVDVASISSGDHIWWLEL